MAAARKKKEVVSTEPTTVVDALNDPTLFKPSVAIRGQAGTRS